MKDSFGREINYMRISITRKCDLFCSYCRTRNDASVSAGSDETGDNANGGDKRYPTDYELSVIDIYDIACVAASLGINRFKITGGEPLLRQDTPQIISRLRSIPEVKEVTLTTNGVLLGKRINELSESGVDRINVSLDTVNEKDYELLTGRPVLNEVLDGVRKAVDRNIHVRLNCLNRGPLTHAAEIVRVAEDLKTDIRFIELMPLGAGKSHDSYSNENIIKELTEEFGEPVKINAKAGNGPAVYYLFPKLDISVGFISAINNCFCETCNRIRLTSYGTLKPCLCYNTAVDLRNTLALSNEELRLRELRSLIEMAVSEKPERHSFFDIDKVTEEYTMDCIGG